MGRARLRRHVAIEPRQAADPHTVAQQAVDFVGTHNGVHPGSGDPAYWDFDMDHQAVFGQRADQVLATIDAPLASEEPDVVLLDLHLPKVDGWKVIEFIRGQDRTRHMPVIILASSQDITRQLDAHQGSETAVIPKPVQAAEVLKALERMSHAQLL